MTSLGIIGVLGAGSFGTAVATVLARNGQDVVLYCRDEMQCAEINEQHSNCRAFPGYKLPLSVRSAPVTRMKGIDVLFLGIPAAEVGKWLEDMRPNLDDVLVVNLVKGLHSSHFTFDALFALEVPKARFVSLKGPTFARPLFLGELSGMTCGATTAEDSGTVTQLFSQSNVLLDYSDSPRTVELLSAAKNVYAIAIGLAESLALSDNTTYLLVSGIINEIRTIILRLELELSAIYRHCGLGDMLLTGLCDASRNRTLGLMIGRGLTLADGPPSFLVEGRRSAGLLNSRVPGKPLPILRALNGVLLGHAPPLEVIEAIRATGVYSDIPERGGT